MKLLIFAGITLAIFLAVLTMLLGIEIILAGLIARSIFMIAAGLALFATPITVAAFIHVHRENVLLALVGAATVLLAIFLALSLMLFGITTFCYGLFAGEIFKAAAGLSIIMIFIVPPGLLRNFS